MTFYMLQLTVSNLERSIAWYQHFGYRAELYKVEERFALLTHGNFRLALKESSPDVTAMLTREPKFVRLHFEVRRLHEMVARLRQSGLEAAKPLLRSPEGYERVVYQDPDGYEMCLFEWVTAG